MLQSLNSSLFPLQGAPPYEGRGLLHLLVLKAAPAPQVLLQGPHLDQLLHPPASLLCCRLSVRPMFLLVLSHRPLTHHCDTTIIRSSDHHHTNLLRTTGRPVHRRSLLGLTEERRVGVSTPEVLAGVRQLETPAKRVAAVKLHPALIIKTVLVLDLISDHRVVDCLREVRSNTFH